MSYVQFIGHAVLGRLREADAIFTAHEQEIRSYAKQLAFHMLRQDQLGTIYRGVRLKARTKVLAPLPHMKFLQFSEDKSVACHFADSDPYRGFPSLVDLGQFGHIISYRPLVEEVLFHHSYLRQYHLAPFLFAGLSQAAGGYFGRAEVQELLRQKEVMLVQERGRTFNVYPFENECQAYVKAGGLRGVR